MEKLTKSEILEEAIMLLTKSKGDYPLNDLNLDIRRFRNKLLKSEIMPAWEVEETVAKLHDFLLDFRNVPHESF